MSELSLGAVERRFAEIIWNNEPLSSGELVKLAQNELSWKKSTTYTVLKKLTDRGIFKNENGTVTSVLSRADFDSRRSESVVESEFGGSLPDFVAAFTSHRKLTPEEADRIRRMIDAEAKK